MPRLAPLPGHVLTLIFVMLGWALFRAQDWEGVRAMFSGLGGHNGIRFTADFLANTRPIQIVTIALGIGLVYLPAAVQVVPNPNRLSAWPPFAVGFPLWILSIWLIQTRSVIPFLYFQF
jgi:alginate O-acetyltransferase complex protein AlgI